MNQCEMKVVAASIGFGCTGNALPVAEAAAQPPAEAKSGLIQ